MWVPGPNERVKAVKPNDAHSGREGVSAGWRVDYGGRILIRVWFSGGYGWHYYDLAEIEPD